MYKRQAQLNAGWMELAGQEEKLNQSEAALFLAREQLRQGEGKLAAAREEIASKEQLIADSEAELSDGERALTCLLYTSRAYRGREAGGIRSCCPGQREEPGSEKEHCNGAGPG